MKMDVKPLVRHETISEHANASATHRRNYTLSLAHTHLSDNADRHVLLVEVAGLQRSAQRGQHVHDQFVARRGLERLRTRTDGRTDGRSRWREAAPGVSYESAMRAGMIGGDEKHYLKNTPLEKQSKNINGGRDLTIFVWVDQ
jgi:hypothetical protein